MTPPTSVPRDEQELRDKLQEAMIDYRPATLVASLDSIMQLINQYAKTHADYVIGKDEEETPSRKPNHYLTRSQRTTRTKNILRQEQRERNEKGS